MFSLLSALAFAGPAPETTYAREAEAAIWALQQGEISAHPMHVFLRVLAEETEGGAPVSRVQVAVPIWHDGIWKDVSLAPYLLGLPATRDMMVVDQIPVTPAHVSLEPRGPELTMDGAWPVGDLVEAWVLVDARRRAHAVPVLTPDGALRGWATRQVAALIPVPWAAPVLNGRLRPPTPAESLELFELARVNGDENEANLTIVYLDLEHPRYNFSTGNYEPAYGAEGVRAPTRLAMEVSTGLADRPASNVQWDPFGRWSLPLPSHAATAAERVTQALDAAIRGDLAPATAVLPSIPQGQAQDLLLLAAATDDALKRTRERILPALRDPTSDERALCFFVSLHRPDLSTAGCAGVNREVPAYVTQLLQAGYRTEARALLVELSHLRPLLPDETLILARIAATEPGGGLIALALLQPLMDKEESKAISTCRQIAFDTEAFEPGRCVAAP
jgi:hypothetical protein